MVSMSSMQSPNLRKNVIATLYFKYSQVLIFRQCQGNAHVFGSRVNNSYNTMTYIFLWYLRDLCFHSRCHTRVKTRIDVTSLLSLILHFQWN